MDGKPCRGNLAELRLDCITGEGGASAISKFAGGRNISISRTGTGAYLLTWAQNPGNFVGWSAGIGAATPANVAGHTVVRGEYSASAKTLAFVVYNAADAAHDLAADEYVDVQCMFVTSAVDA